MTLTGLPRTALRGPNTSIRWGAWFGDSDFELTFPEGWLVTDCPPADGPDIGESGIADAFAHPIGTPLLREIAQGRRSPCVVIDDLSRPTSGVRLIPPILAELAAAGITAADTVVLAGVANHRTLMREDLIKKLGQAVVDECQVRNHFSWARCTEIGVTSRGTPVQLNDDFLASDLKILVGSIVPHPVAGFSGGAKLVLPAVASNASAGAFHSGVPLPGEGVATVESTARHDAEEAAVMAGVDFIVNSVPTTQLGIAGLVTGDLVQAHRAGVKIAQATYATTAPAGADVVVLSSYPKDNEFLQYSTSFTPLVTASSSLVRPGGTVVVASAGSEGRGFHSLFGMDKRFTGGAPVPPGENVDLVLFSPGVRRGDLDPEHRDRAPLFATWEETVEWLAAKHGPGTTVSVFPSAVTQLVTEVSS